MGVHLTPDRLLPQATRSALQQALEAYYQQASEYPTYSAASAQTRCWEHLGQRLDAWPKEREGTGGTTTLLEVGAANSGLGDWLVRRGLRDKVVWHAQDINEKYLLWLQAHADAVFIGQVSGMRQASTYDIIISSYVLEHVTNPLEHLSALLIALRPGGSLFIFCPRYDLPGYLCPGSRSFGIGTRLHLSAEMVYHRICTLLLRRPAFLLQSVLGGRGTSFSSDEDAVHWVSLWDLRVWAQHCGLKFSKLSVKGKPGSPRDWIVKHWLTCAVELQKPAQPSA